MLSLNDVSLRLGGRDILRGVSFALRPGCLTVLVGRNGSGKSTLLSCISQQANYAGAITLGGRDLRSFSPRDRAKSIAYLPQTLGAPRITVREMAAFGRSPHLDFTGRLTDADHQAVERALVAADALPLAERYVDALSGGERQLAALAMILAQEAPIALLDEPTAHMDQAREAAFLRRVKGMEGHTFLVVLHDLTLAAEYADDLLVLDEGRLIFAGSREECLGRRVLEEVFSLRRVTVHEDGRERVFFTAQ